MTDYAKHIKTLQRGDVLALTEQQRRDMIELMRAAMPMDMAAEREHCVHSDCGAARLTLESELSAAKAEIGHLRELASDNEAHASALLGDCKALQTKLSNLRAELKGVLYALPQEWHSGLLAAYDEAGR